MTGFGELVVGGPGDDLRLQLRDRAVVEDGAERARGEDVDVETEDLFRRDHGGAQLLASLQQRLAVDVGDPELRACSLELAGEVEADVAHALHRDAQAFQ